MVSTYLNRPGTCVDLPLAEDCYAALSHRMHRFTHCAEVNVRIPRHPDTQPTNIRTLVPRSFGQAVGAQRRRFALLV
jgi:hypothetical protein